MPITDAYADNAKYKAVVGKTTGDNDSEIDAQLLACSRYMERRLERFFTKDASALTRLYIPREVGLGERERPQVLTGLRIDDMAAAPTLIRIDEGRDGTFEKTLAATDYEIRPRNATRGPEPKPYTTIELLWSGAYTAWVPDSVVEVTAVWGWPAVPEAIAQGVCQIVGILRLESARATNMISQGFDSFIGASPAAQTIVDRLINVYGHRTVYA